MNGRHIKGPLKCRYAVHSWNTLELHGFKLAVMIEIGKSHSQALLFVDYQQTAVSYFRYINTN